MEEFNLTGESQDLGRNRTLVLENGNKVHFKQSDPYGFWTVNFDKGMMPEMLTGQYTTYDFAEKAVRSYLNSKGRTVVEPEKEATLFPEETTKPTLAKAGKTNKPKAA